MKNFRNRAAQKARDAASGGEGPPAGQDPAAPGRPATADRRRLRLALRARDDRLHELGALVMEMYRQGRHNPALVEAKAREAIAADAVVRELSGASPAAPPSGAPAPSAAPPPIAAARADGSAPIGAAPPPAPADRVDAPAPAAPDRVSAPPPSGADRVERPDDGVPTYSATTR